MAPVETARRRAGGEKNERMPRSRKPGRIPRVREQAAPDARALRAVDFGHEPRVQRAHFRRERRTGLARDDGTARVDGAHDRAIVGQDADAARLATEELAR